MSEETDETGESVAGCERAPLDEPAPPPPAPTVTVTVLADVTVIVAGPQLPLPEPPITGEFPLTGAFPLTAEFPPADEPAPPLETAPLLLTGRGETVTVEYMTGALPVPVGPAEVPLS